MKKVTLDQLSKSFEYMAKMMNSQILTFEEISELYPCVSNEIGIEELRGAVKIIVGGSFYLQKQGLVSVFDINRAYIEYKKKKELKDIEFSEDAEAAFCGSRSKRVFFEKWGNRIEKEVLEYIAENCKTSPLFKKEIISILNGKKIEVKKKPQEEPLLTPEQKEIEYFKIFGRYPKKSPLQEGEVVE